MMQIKKRWKLNGLRSCCFMDGRPRVDQVLIRKYGNNTVSALSVGAPFSDSSGESVLFETVSPARA